MVGRWKCGLSMSSAVAPRVVEVKVGKPHRAVLNASRRFVDVEGAFRAAKTWTCLMKIRRRLTDEPGIKGFIARWTEDGLMGKLVPDYRNVCRLMGVPTSTWNARESCYDFPNGSRLYAIYLKTQRNDDRYSKVRGLTVAFGYIDQLEEVPEDVYDEAEMRLSQPGYPQQMIVSPNPVPESHWISKKFPADDRDPDRAYIRLSIWDNAHNLDPQTIAAAERKYPIGHPARPAKLEGRRGPDIQGKPVYGGMFLRARHVDPNGVVLNPSLPLLELYDFGFHHPCVIWMQWAPWGQVRVLGGVMGEDLHLPKFLPVVQRYRDQWFPSKRMLLAACDPAGASQNSQGLEGTPQGLIESWYRQHGLETVSVQFIADANHPEKRVTAIQTAATYMDQTCFNGEPAFVVDGERWALVNAGGATFEDFFITGLEVGYVLEAEPRHSSKLGTMWLPKKDGWFEHGQNCFEYGVQSFVKDIPIGEAKQPAAHARHMADAALRQAIEAKAQLRKELRDTHPEDAPRGRVQVAGRRRFFAGR